MGQLGLQMARVRVTARVGGQPGSKVLSCLLEGPVLQEPGEEQITLPKGIHGGLVAHGFVLHRQEGGALGLHQYRGHIQEGAGLVQPLAEVQGAHIVQKLPGDGGQRDLSQGELAVGQHAQQQVEGPLVDIQVDGEAVR